MSVERRDRVRAYDVYALITALLTGLGAIAAILAMAFGGPFALAVSSIPLAAAFGLGTRLFNGWTPDDRSLDRSIPEEANQ